MSEDDQVRRLLADARHTEPIPPDVAEQLDGVLADLRDDRPVRPAVTDLAAARRRRRARTMLVAAAAVVVVGVAVDQLRGVSTPDDSNAGSAADSSVGAAESAPDGASAGGEAEARRFESGEAARIDAQSFGEKVLRLREQRVRLTSDAAAGELRTMKARCAAGDGRAGRLVPVRYDGSPGVLFYRPPRGDTQVVDLYLCGRDDVARSITLPAP